MRLKKARISSFELENSIVALIKTAPRTSAQLRDLLDVERQTVQRRLYDLQEAGIIHTVADPLARLLTALKLWALGPAGRKPPAPGESFNRIFTKNAAPHHHRDPWVAALFGPGRA